MSWYEFVFSERKPHRYIRHIIFWLSWWLYYFVSKYLLPQPIQRPLLTPQQPIPIRGGTEYLIFDTADLVQSVLILFIQILACYALIYFLLPRYLLKAKYFLFLAGIILLSFTLVESSHFIHSVVMPPIETIVLKTPSPSKTSYWASVSSGGISAIKIFAFAVAIKLVKHWYRKQKEKDRLEREKIDAELQLLKVQIHPQFLFNTLQNIYSFALTASPNAPEMLIKLSDILSYMLYECNEKLVQIEKEIKVLKDYMSLEKIRYGDKLEMNIHVKGDLRDKRIAPLLLWGFIENSFRQCSIRTTEQPWINLEMVIEEQVLEMRLMNGKPSELPVLEEGEEDDLAQAQKRLQLLYPESHELKITEELEIMMVILRVNLQENKSKVDNLPQRQLRKEELSVEIF